MISRQLILETESIPLCLRRPCDCPDKLSVTTEDVSVFTCSASLEREDIKAGSGGSPPGEGKETLIGERGDLGSPGDCGGGGAGLLVEEARRGESLPESLEISDEKTELLDGTTRRGGDGGGGGGGDLL